MIGCAVICINKDKKVLMVLKDENGKKKWTLPVTDIKEGESLSGCTIRGARESTGYLVEITDKLYKKTKYLEDYILRLHYFEVKINARLDNFNNPDIEQVAWVDIEDINVSDLSLPEDKYMIQNLIKEKIKQEYKNKRKKISNDDKAPKEK